MRPILVLPVAALVLAPYGAWPQDNPVGPEFQINTYTTERQELSSVAASADDFVVVWHSLNQDGSSYGVYGQRYTSTGTPLGPEFRVNTYTTSSQDRPSVGADPVGNFVVVWDSLYQDGSVFGVFGQRYASTGAPLGPEFRVNTFITSSQRHPAVAAYSSGNFVVVWNSDYQDGSAAGVFGQRYASSGAPLGPEFRVNTYTTSTQFYPSVAADPSGNFVVVWQSHSQDGSSYGIYGQRYASTGTPLGPEFRVNTFTTDGQFSPRVAVDPSGGFVVAWSRSIGGVSGVLAQRFSSAGAPLGSEFRVNTYTGSPQFGPSVATDSSGNFVVVWWTLSGVFSWDVFGQLYASSGAPVGPHFIVNTQTLGLQARPSVAAFPSGHFVVVWDSYQDGSHNGVFGQRYDSMVVPVELLKYGVE